MDEQLTLYFVGNIQDLVSLPTSAGKLVYPLTRRASIKDIIEAVGVPHIEIRRLDCGAGEIDLGYIPSGGEEILVYSFDRQNNWRTVSALRKLPFERICFLVDMTALKLARNLRMAGLDTAVVREVKLKDIVSIANREKRIVITRNRELAKVKELHYGQLLRSEDHIEQFKEVEERYELSTFLQPMSRCLVCNELLAAVKKEQIIHRLEPLTKKYFTTFKECPSCRKIYWPGSHHERMAEMLDLMRKK